MRGFDYEQLRGRRVIAVNSSIVNVQWADVFFTADWHWFSACYQLLQGFKGEKYAAIQPEHHERFSHLGITWLRRSHDPGISDDPSTIRLRANSGYGAVQVAILKGARRIELFGFDLLPGRADLSDTRPEELSRYDQWRREFQALLSECAKAGIVVAHAKH